MRQKLTVLSIILGLFGVLMVYSASQVWALYKEGNEYFYLIRQLIFYLLGVVVFLVTKNIKIEYYYKYATHLYIIGIGLLILVLIPGIGIVRGGARSWIGINQFSIQPSEIVKICTIFITAKYISLNYKEIEKFRKMLVVLIYIALVFVLIMLEPDFGTGLIIVGTILCMLLFAGINRKFIYLGIVSGVLGFAGLVLSAPYRLNRIFAFLDPFSDPLGGGFQIIQSLYALSPAGLFGVGLFNSRQKYFYLPEPQTDFIFSIIFEECGFIGSMGLMIVFFLIFYYGIKIAYNTTNKFNKFLALGITISIFIQFFINIGVVIGLLPVTGVTLPFMSYGGSSLLLNYFMIGLLVRIDKESSEGEC